MLFTKHRVFIITEDLVQYFILSVAGIERLLNKRISERTRYEAHFQEDEAIQDCVDK